MLARASSFLGDRFLPALQYPDYRSLWMASVCSHSSAWALIVARGALAKTLTGSDLWTGMVTFAAMIPSVLVSPFAGYLADRFDRRTVMIGAYLVNLAHNLLLALLVLTGTIEAWHLVLLALLNGSARSTQMPAASALLANTSSSGAPVQWGGLAVGDYAGLPISRAASDPAAAMDNRSICL